MTMDNFRFNVLERRGDEIFMDFSGSNVIAGRDIYIYIYNPQTKARTISGI